MTELELNRSHGYAPIASSLPARSALSMVGGTVLLALCSHLAVPLPWTPVPMTMQPFAVLLLALVLGRGLGAATMALYLLEGAFGLPIFTPGGGLGLAHLFGPTGGYLLSYPAAAILAGGIYRGGVRRSLSRALAGAAAAEVLILLCGAGWLMAATHAHVTAVLRAAVLPFLPGDALKVVLAALLAAGWTHTRARRAGDPVKA